MQLLIAMLLGFLLPAASVQAQSVADLFAQLQTLDASGEVRIETEPVFPEPGTSVTLSLKSSTIALQSAEVLWVVDGEIQNTDPHAQSITITAPPVEDPLPVTAYIRLPNETLKTGTTINSSRLVLLHEAESYTPPLYGGRAQAGDKTPIRLSAVAEIPKPGGGVYPPEELRYLWRKNGRTIADGLGRSRLRITGPNAAETALITVSVFTRDGVLLGKTGVRLTGKAPELQVYELRPLEGLRLVSVAVAPLLAQPIRVVAVPFFANKTLLTHTEAEYRWFINNQEIPNQHDPILTAEISDNGSTKAPRLSVALFFTRTLLAKSNTFPLSWGVDYQTPSL